MKLNVAPDSSPMPTTITRTASLKSVAESASPTTRLLSVGTQTEAPSRRTCWWGYALGVLLVCSPFLLAFVVNGGTVERDVIRHSSRGIDLRERGWSRWSVVRNGRLYISESLENRLNEHAEQVYGKVMPRFRKCKKARDIGFALNRGMGIRGWVEVTMKCGYGTCIRRGEVHDIRGLVVGVQDGGHYVSSSGGTVWGPLRGPLKVVMDGDGMLALRRVCGETVEVVSVSVNEVRDIVGEVDVMLLGARDAPFG